MLRFSVKGFSFKVFFFFLWEVNPPHTHTIHTWWHRMNWLPRETTNAKQNMLWQIWGRQNDRPDTACSEQIDRENRERERKKRFRNKAKSKWEMEKERRVFESQVVSSTIQLPPELYWIFQPLKLRDKFLSIPLLHPTGRLRQPSGSLFPCPPPFKEPA